MITNIPLFLHALWFTPGVRGRWGLPALFEGPPGDAKSSKIEGQALDDGLMCKTLVGSVREPADFNGLPIPNLSKDGQITSVAMAPQSWALDLEIEGRGVIFLDELTTCPPAVQAAMLRLVLDGALGDHILPIGVRIMAACNPVGQAANGYGITLPMANRFGHYQWPATEATDWVQWLTGDSDPFSRGVKDPATDSEKRLSTAEAEEARVLALWPDAYSVARGAVSGFLQHIPGHLHKMPKKGDPSGSKAWPSPRTWEMATRALAGGKIHGLTESDHDEMVSGFVSAGVYGEFKTWLENTDLPHPADVLDGVIKFKHDRRRLDRTFAVLSGCTALVCPEKSAKRADRSEKLWSILGEIASDDQVQDLTIPAARALVGARLSASKPAREVLTKINPLLMAAGVRPSGAVP